MLNKTTAPLYLELEKLLRKRIIDGEFKPDEIFPTEDQLCQEFGVSKITVRQALSILENDELIRREQGRGTFITRHRGSILNLNLYGYVDDLHQLGAQTILKLFSKKLTAISLDMACSMKLNKDGRLYLFEGIRHLYAEHCAFFQAYVPEELGKNIRLTNFDGSLLIDRVEREALEGVRRAEQSISASVADKKIASMIKVKEGHPLLVMERIYFSSSGRALELAITSFPGDAYKYMSELAKINSSARKVSSKKIHY